jgi:hypothetical protein
MASLDATVSAAQVETVAQRGAVQFGGDSGTAIDAQVRANLDRRHGGAAFECGTGGREAQGRAAFDKLMTQIEAAAWLPIPPHASVVRQSQRNAITLPGTPAEWAALKAICAGS